MKKKLLKKRITTRYSLFLIVFFLLFAQVSNAQAGKSKLPKPDHIIIVIEENHGFEDIIGSANAPFINSLAKKGMLFTDYHGVAHPSQPNYIALYSGSTQGVVNDICLKNVTPYITPNLGAAMITAGYTFKGYSQTLPADSSMACYYKKSELNNSYLYGRKHCPWVNWIGNGKNNISASLSLPMTKFPSSYSKLPTLAFVIPDMDHDMHNIGKQGDAFAVKMGDDWLRNNLSRYANWAMKHNSLLIITFDEDNFTLKNHIPTIFIGSMVKKGVTSVTANHYDLHRTIEAMYGLPPGGENDGKVIEGIWK